MDLVFASLFCPPTGKRVVYETKSFSSTLNAARRLYARKIFPCLATVATQTTQASEFELENRKHDLLRAIQDTQRGLVITADQRSSIEEALVSVEGYDAGAQINLMKLDGTWRLQYTSASDVLILLESAVRIPFFQVGQIFQKFECRDNSDRGIVRNVVRWSIPTLLEEQEGATLLVSAKFNVVSMRNIYLQFEEIAVQNINISEELQALIAPALLPRSFLSLQLDDFAHVIHYRFFYFQLIKILQFIRAFKAQIPLRNPERQSVGGLYYLSYLDDNMLLGRALGGGGAFVFTRAQPLG